MGHSQSSKFGPESVVQNTAKKDHPINFVNSHVSGSSNSETGMSSKFYKPNNSVSAMSSKEANLVNTSFKWAFGGHTVAITGTFTNWKDHVPLQKVGNEFSVIMRLARGVYQYKFIVDGDWKFSPDDPTSADEHGNINNVIDTTNVESMNRIIDQKSRSILKSKETVKEPNPQAQPNVLTPNLNFSEQAPSIPAHLMHIVYLNEREKLLESNKFRKSSLDMEIEKPSSNIPNNFSQLEVVYRTFENTNTLSPPTHVVLNHLGTPKSKESASYTVNTMTQRFKSKYATIKFYTSKFVQPVN